MYVGMVCLVSTTNNGRSKPQNTVTPCHAKTESSMLLEGRQNQYQYAFPPRDTTDMVITNPFDTSKPTNHDFEVSYQRHASILSPSMATSHTLQQTIVSPTCL